MFFIVSWFFSMNLLIEFIKLVWMICSWIGLIRFSNSTHWLIYPVILGNISLDWQKKKKMFITQCYCMASEDWNIAHRFVDYCYCIFMIAYLYAAFCPFLRLKSPFLIHCNCMSHFVFHGRMNKALEQHVAK